ncbi:MAG TPA: hypothetical protein VKA83_09335 [Methylomirabilota bacterium]|nr:hypothetical protein [Methylomirabilota bacterium]
MSKRRSHAAHDAGSNGVALGMPALNGAPWYAKLVIWTLASFGFPVAICVAFFMIFIGQLPSPLTTTAAEIKAHREETHGLLEFVKTNTRLQRQICRNTSRDPAERVFCDQ